MIDDDDEYYGSIEYHIKPSVDHKSITLTIVAEEPITQDEFYIMLLSFAQDMKLGQASGNSEWILDEDMEAH